MRASDIAIGMRVTTDDPLFTDTQSLAGVVVDIDPEDPGHEFLVRWDDGGQRWVAAHDLEPEGDES